MTAPKPVGVQWEQEDETLEGGRPTGNIMFIAVPELTYVALSDAAAKRGITAIQAFAQALDLYLKQPPPK